jgi:hypothetical protein
MGRSSVTQISGDRQGPLVELIPKRTAGELIDNANDQQAQKRDQDRKAYGEFPRQTKTNLRVLNASGPHAARGVSAGTKIFWPMNK